MSLLARHNVPFFSLVKKTYAFILSKRHFKDLAQVPALFLILITFFALNSVVEIETPQGKLQNVNILFSLLFLVSSFVFYILSMVRTHLYYANGENPRLWREKSFYVKGMRYVLFFISAVLAGILITGLWAAVLYTIVYYFLGFHGFTFRLFAMASVAISPYFIIRFCCIFPAMVSDEKLFLFGAWKMTQGMSSSLAINYVFIGSIPFLAICLATSLLTLFVKAGIPFVILNFLSVYLLLFALFVSAVFQAVFMNVVYDCLKERKLENNVAENAFFSIAKNKNSD